MRASLPSRRRRGTVAGMAELTLLSRRYERAPRRPPAVVLTKLRPPRAAPGTLPRPRLVHLLDEGAGRPLTVVVAPAGFGKTTLLAQWAAACSLPVAWVSLDERDRDPFRLWAHVGASLAAAVPELMPLTGPEVPLDTLIPRLAEAVAAGAPSALVLDDYHRLGRGASDATLRWFAEQAAPALRVVLSARVPPPFPLGLMRARGELLEIGPRQLGLTEVEARAILEHLDAAAPASLVEELDGWPAGLLLRADRGDASELVATQGLAALEPNERRFLLDASILDRLGGAACDHVLGREGSLSVLRAIERRSPFLVALDDRREEYRLHRAFAPTLRRALLRTAGGRVAELHLRAASWHRRRGELDAALEHAVAAGAAREAAALIRRGWRQEVDRGRHAHVLAELERLPDEAVDARLELVRAWLLHLEGRRDEGITALDTAVATAKPRAKPLVEREAALLQAAFCWDGPHGAPGPGPTAAWAAGWGLWWRGRDDDAEPHLREACGGAVIVACAATAVLSRIAGARGERDRAEQLARDACARAEEHGLALGMAPSALGAALAAQGRTAEAAPLLEEGLRLRRAWGHPLELVDSLLLLAPVAAGIDGRARAASLLAEAGARLQECGDPGPLAERLEQARRRSLPRPGTVKDEGLTDRELTVLRLLASGRTKRAIAAELHLSFNTVHSHTKSIYRKLGASTRAQAVA
ncbi:MAG TPA: LuxR C-terminal-related transcriptional regulator, partial [Gaiellaceae bacterium]|nr:LuxR C-terminal-related transcriptional regulator [Gaiellaceae bacterium]